MTERQISTGRKTVYYIGVLIAAIGFLLIFSAFIFTVLALTGIVLFEWITLTFGGAFIGFILIAIGMVLVNIGKAGLAGSEDAGPFWTNIRMKTAYAALTFIVIMIIVFLIADRIPLCISTGYRCWDCGARGTKTQVLFISTSMKVKEGPLSHYWRSDVDPHHKHRWAALYSNIGLIASRHADHTSNFHPRRYMKDECLIAILKSLPDSNARKAFMAKLTNHNDRLSSKDYEDLHNFAHTLRHAYEDNPKRTDWDSIINSANSASTIKLKGNPAKN